MFVIIVIKLLLKPLHMLVFSSTHHGKKIRASFQVRSIKQRFSRSERLFSLSFANKPIVIVLHKKSSPDECSCPEISLQCMFLTLFSLVV